MNEMVQAVINIENHTNQVLNIVKAKYNLKDKSQAIDLVVKQYENVCLEPQLRPAYKKELEQIMTSKHFSKEEMEAMI